MRKLAIAGVVLTFALAQPADATIFDIDLSPSGGALNLGSTTYTQDHAVGISALNETAPTASTGSGDEFGGGITFDDATNTLTFDIAYGSAFGFSDLASDFNSGVHFHAPGAVNFPAANTSAGVIVNLGGFHTPSGARSGRITGATVLSALNETNLFDNLMYINIHSVGVPSGEIRGQLVPVPEPSSGLLCLMALLFLPLLLLRREC